MNQQLYMPDKTRNRFTARPWGDEACAGKTCLLKSLGITRTTKYNRVQFYCWCHTKRKIGGTLPANTSTSFGMIKTRCILQHTPHTRVPRFVEKLEKYLQTLKIHEIKQKGKKKIKIVQNIVEQHHHFVFKYMMHIIICKQGYCWPVLQGHP